MDEIHDARETRVVDPTGLVYSVRAVPRGVRLRKRENLGPVPGTSAGDVFASVLADVVSPLISAWRAEKQTGWKIGVLRDGGLLGQAIVHKEISAAGMDPAARIEEIVRLIRSGEFKEQPRQFRGRHR